MSVEHHARNEIVLDNVENWEFLAPQTEQEVGDGPDAVSLEIRNSRNLLFANYHGYRVTRSYHPARSAVRLFNSGAHPLPQRPRERRERHCQLRPTRAAAPSCARASIRSTTRSRTSRAGRSSASTSSPRSTSARPIARPVAPPASLDAGRAAGRGLLVDLGRCGRCAEGALYFIDRHFQRIHRWSDAKGLEVVRDQPLDAVNLAVDASGHLMVLSSLGPQRRGLFVRSCRRRPTR